MSPVSMSCKTTNIVPRTSLGVSYVMDGDIPFDSALS